MTYDPRGAGRNPVGSADISTEQHVDDLHRVIRALDVGPIDAFGSSGGRRHPVTEFPSNHGGFTVQPGMPSDPDGFAARLREVLG